MTDRYHWATYKPAATPHTEWLKQAQTSFTNLLLSIIEDPKDWAYLIPTDKDADLSSGEVITCFFFFYSNTVNRIHY